MGKPWVGPWRPLEGARTVLFWLQWEAAVWCSAGDSNDYLYIWPINDVNCHVVPRPEWKQGDVPGGCSPSSLFTDSVFANSSACNLFVTWKSILQSFGGHSWICTQRRKIQAVFQLGLTKVTLCVVSALRLSTSVLSGDCWVPHFPHFRALCLWYHCWNDPQASADLLSGVCKCKKPVTCFMEKIHELPTLLVDMTY